MQHKLIIANVLAAASNGHHLSVGPWIIVPILIVVAIIATPIYIARDRRKRRANDWTK